LRLLLDSHIYLWFLLGEERLAGAMRESIEDASNLVYVSAASVWELAIKAALGRLDLDGVDLADEIERSGFTQLPVSARHGQTAANLPRHHRDPFDRVLVAQAQLEDLSLVSTDETLSRYDVHLIAG
jgi:PIN domain nuclease of toxin-antitoxin system